MLRVVQNEDNLHRRLHLQPFVPRIRGWCGHPHRMSTFLQEIIYYNSETSLLLAAISHKSKLFLVGHQKVNPTYLLSTLQVLNPAN